MTGTTPTRPNFSLVDVWLGLEAGRTEVLEDGAQFQYLPLSGTVNPQNGIIRTLLCMVIH